MFWAVPGNSMGSISLRWRASIPAKTKGVDKSEIIAGTKVDANFFLAMVKTLLS